MVDRPLSIALASASIMNYPTVGNYPPWSVVTLLFGILLLIIALLNIEKAAGQPRPIRNVDMPPDIRDYIQNQIDVSLHLPDK